MQIKLTDWQVMALEEAVRHYEIPNMNEDAKAHYRQLIDLVSGARTIRLETFK